MASKIIDFNKDLSARFRADIAKERNVVGKKIQAARKALGMTQAECAKEISRYGINMQPPAFTKWERGENTPNAYQLMAICYLLKIENGLDYFVGGIDTGDPPNGTLNADGRRLLDAYRTYLESIPKYRKGYQRPVEMVTMPVSMVPASAGFGQFLDGNQFEEREFPESTIPEGSDYAVQVSGDSMEPTYIDGQYAWIAECEWLRPGDVGLFVLNGDGYIKVYDEQEPDDYESFIDHDGVVHPQIVLISYNKKYAPIRVSPDSDFRVVGRVLN